MLYVFSEYHTVPVPDVGQFTVTYLPMAWAPGEDEARCEVRLTVRPSGMISDYAWRGTDCVD